MDCDQSPKLSLDLSPPWLPSHPKPFSREKTKRVDDSSSVELKENIARLEAELRKIEAFKRELPLSVLILNEAIEKLKEEANGNRKGLSTSGVADAPDNYCCWKVGTKLESYDANDDDQTAADKKSWMSSAQLWSSNGDGSDHSSFLQLKSTSKQRPDDDSNDDTVRNCKSSSTGAVGVRASLDKGQLSLSTATRELDAAAVSATTLLSLNNTAGLRLESPPLTPARNYPANEPVNEKKLLVRSGGREQQISGKVFADEVTVVRKSSPSTPIQQQQQYHGGTFKSSGRKQRRCWSPELHRRFIDALEKLGGSKVATPKQIREVMQVDGLTNDEVKSHLQKYRLHIRKLPNTTMSLSRSGEDYSDEQEEASNKNRNSRCKDDDSDSNQSASPEGPLHLSSVLTGTGTVNSNSCASRYDDNNLEDEMRDAEEERSDGMSIGK